MTVDVLIDRFVDSINRAPREPKRSDEVPPALRLAEDIHGFYDWQVQRSDRNDWVEAFEAKLPCRLPRSFRSLVVRYQFPALEVGPLVLFANTSEGTSCELRHQAFADEGLSTCLLRNELVQFGRPSTGSYDPVCFDTRRPAHRREFPILWLDHEEILCNQRIRVVKPIASSFHEFVTHHLSDR